MFSNFKVVVATPAGRRDHLRTLFPYILKNIGLIDEYHIWLNTNLAFDVDFILNLAKRYDFVKIIEYPGISERFPAPQPPFYGYCKDEETIYVKVDDDICYIHDKAFEEILAFRFKNPKYFAILGNIINNGFTTYIHQKNGAFLYDERISPDWHNSVWSSSKVGNEVHRQFIQSLTDNDIESYFFDTWILDRYERFSIQFMTWFGSDFAEFDGIIPGYDEELWLCCIKPKEIKRPLAICGKSLVSHFASYRQRQPHCGEDGEIDKRIFKAYDFISRNGVNKGSIKRIMNLKSLL